MDKRHLNNQSAQQRRQSIYARRRKKQSKRPDRLTQIEAAKAVLRRTGKKVYNGEIEDPRFRGWIIVDTRRLRPADVLRLAAEQLRRERLRNEELRREHGLPIQARRQRR